MALGSGAAAGAAILVRPSWALFVPAMLAIRIIANLRDRRALIASVRDALHLRGRRRGGDVAVVGPQRLDLRTDSSPPPCGWAPVCTTASTPRPPGASDMTFLRDPEIWPLDEQDQDVELTRRAFAFARAEPMRVISLAAIKLGRYWTPWPNADVLQNPRRGRCRHDRGTARPGADHHRRLGSPPRPVRLGPARRAVALFLLASPGLRQLDAIPDPRRNSRVWAWRPSAGPGLRRGLCVEKQWDFATKWPLQNSPGQRPGKRRTVHVRALTGRNNSVPLCRPFRASGVVEFPCPGRCPRLICCCPFGAENQRPMRIGRRLRKVVFWGIVFCLTTLWRWALGRVSVLDRWQNGRAIDQAARRSVRCRVRSSSRAASKSACSRVSFR